MESSVNSFAVYDVTIAMSIVGIFGFPFFRGSPCLQPGEPRIKYAISEMIHWIFFFIASFNELLCLSASVRAAFVLLFLFYHIRFWISIIITKL